MNAAARLVHQQSLSRHLVFTHVLTARQATVIALSFALVMSAIGIIYITENTRVVHAAYQHQLTAQNQLHIQHSQLLLERSATLMPSHVQHIAEHQLEMVTPDHSSIIVVRK